MDEVKTASAVAPTRGRGTAAVVDEVPTRAPNFVVSLSIALDSRITANLSLALRAARVKAQCPSEAAVRALNLCGGVNPSNPPHAAQRRAAMGFAPPARQRFARRKMEVSRPTFSVSP